MARARGKGVKTRFDAEPGGHRWQRVPPTEKRAIEILDVRDTATKTEVRKAYKSLIKVLHPDMNGGDRSQVFFEPGSMTDLHKGHIDGGVDHANDVELTDAPRVGPRKGAEVRDDTADALRPLLGFLHCLSQV